MQCRALARAANGEVAAIALLAAARLSRMARSPGGYLGLRPSHGIAGRSRVLTLAPASGLAGGAVPSNDVPAAGFDEMVQLEALLADYSPGHAADGGVVEPTLGDTAPLPLVRRVGPSAGRSEAQVAERHEGGEGQSVLAHLQRLALRVARSLVEYRSRYEEAERQASERAATLQTVELLNSHLDARLQELQAQTTTMITAAQLEQLHSAHALEKDEAARETQQMREEVDTLQAELAAQRARASELQLLAEQAGERARTDASEMVRREITDLRERLGAKEGECSSLAEYLRCKAKEMVALQEERAGATSKLRAAQTELSSTELHAERMMSHATSLEAELDERRAKLAGAEAAAVAAIEDASQERARADELQATLVQVAPEYWHSRVRTQQERMSTNDDGGGKPANPCTAGTTVAAPARSERNGATADRKEAARAVVQRLAAAPPPRGSREQQHHFRARGGRAVEVAVSAHRRRGRVASRYYLMG